MPRARCSVANSNTTPATNSSGSCHTSSDVVACRSPRCSSPPSIEMPLPNPSNNTATGAAMKASDTDSSVTASVK